MFDPFEVDPTLPNNPHLPTNKPMSVWAKLAVTIHKQTVGLPNRKRLRLEIVSVLAGKRVIKSTNELSHEETLNILERIFPHWNRDVFYPPMETRKHIRALAEYLCQESKV